MRILIFLFLLFLSLQYCHHIENGRVITFETKGNETEFTFISPNTNGWSTFGFFVLNKTSLNHTFVWNQTFSSYGVFKSPKVNFITYKKLLSEGKLEYSYIHLHISLKIANSALENQTHIFYEENTNSFNLFENPTKRKVEFLPILTNKLDINECSELLSDRVEVYSVISYSVMLAIHLGICVIPFIFFRFSPYKSRGLIPFLVSISISFAFLTEIRSFFIDYSGLRYECILWSYIYIVLYDVPFAVPLIFYIRYFIIINLKRLDPKFLFNEVVENGQVIKKLKLYLRLFKYISHPLTSLIIIFLYYITNYIIYSIVLGTGSFQCTFDLAELIDTVNAALNLTIFALGFVVLIIDMILNINLLARCKCRKYLVDDDPFFYRLEIIQIVPILILMIFGELTHFIPLSDYVIISRKISHSLAFYMLLYLHVIFPAILTSIQIFKDCFLKKVDIPLNEIDRIYEIPDLWKAFYEFSKKEWHSENVMFIEEIQKLKRKSLIKNECSRIYDTYLNGNASIYELNVTRDACDKVKECLEKNQLSFEMFDELLRQVKSNLKDPLLRFSQTKYYLNHSNQVVLENTILGVTEKKL